MTYQNEKISLKDLIFITIGCSLYAFGLVTVNIANNLAEGGATGITLIIRYWLHIDPAYSIILLNIPLIWIGYRYLGKKALIYTIYGTTMLSIWTWLWQRIPININIHHDLFLAGVLAGLIGGTGSGLVYRFGGTTGGTDIVARIFEKKRGIVMGKTLLALDVIVLTCSLSYLDLRQMMYTLLGSYVFAQVVNFIQEGAYAARGVIIITNHPTEIANDIIQKMERGVSYLKIEGAFSGQERKALYCVVSPNELNTLKGYINHHDSLFLKFLRQWATDLVLIPQVVHY